MFLSMLGDISSAEFRTEEAEFLRIFKQLRDLNGKRIYIFRWEFMLISICDLPLLCVFVSLGEMIIKINLLKFSWIEFRHLLNQFSLRGQLLDALMVRVLLLNINKWIFE